MPNWTYNAITIKHNDPAMIDRVQNCKLFLGEFLPTPQPLLETEAVVRLTEEQHAKVAANVEQFGYPDWYSWNCANWGTKWDVELENVQRVDANTLTASFESAWSPPIEAYNQLAELGFEIDAKYYEPGMSFAGTYTTEEGECTIEFSSNPDAAREALGEELDDWFGISESLREQQDEDEEV